MIGWLIRPQKVRLEILVASDLMGAQQIGKYGRSGPGIFEGVMRVVVGNPVPFGDVGEAVAKLAVGIETAG